MSENSVPLISEDEIPCMLLPMAGQSLLVPTVTVAEMAPVAPFQQVADTPDWFLGFYEWRNNRVPVLHLDLLNEERLHDLNPQGRVAVLNNTGLNSELPFLAIQSQGIPRMSRVGPKDIKENEGEHRRLFDLMQVSVGMESFAIPDVRALEAKFAELNI